MSCKPILIAAAFLGGSLLLPPASASAQTAYLPSATSASVSVLDTTSNRVTATIPVGNGPLGVAITPDGATVLITNTTDGTVSVINGATNTVTATVPVGHQPNAVVVKADGSRAYVVNGGDSTVSVVDLSRDVVTATIPLISRVGNVPAAGSANAAISPDGSRVYVMNTTDESVSVIDTTTNAFVTAVSVRVSGEVNLPRAGIAVTPDSKSVFAASGTGVVVINTATNTLSGSIAQDSPSEILFSPSGEIAYLQSFSILMYGVAGLNYLGSLEDSLLDTGAQFSVKNFALTPDGGKIYFTTFQNGTVGEMDAKTSTLDASLLIPGTAAVLGPFIGPASPSSLVAAVLPGGRSVQEGTTATVFATMLNTGATALSNCSVALPQGGVNGLSFHYQTTDPSTNALVGLPDVPVSIPANGAQTFLLSLETGSAVSGLMQSLAFDCAGTSPAPVTPGVNTVDLLTSATPVADVIALAATLSGDGIVDVPLSGSAESAFAVATDNNGAAGLIIASVDTGGVVLPVSAVICQSDPVTAQCLAAPAASISVGFPAGTTPTFSIFVTASGSVPFAPATSRLFVRFNDSSGASHGVTSVAVRTVN